MQGFEIKRYYRLFSAIVIPFYIERNPNIKADFECLTLPKELNGIPKTTWHRSN